MNSSEYYKLIDKVERNRNILENIKIKRIPNNVSETDVYIPTVIDINKLVGYDNSRHDNNENWYDAFCNLHKQNSIKYISKRIDFEKMKLNEGCFQMDCPCVSEYKGEYYIHHGGKHRLTIAKCLGIQEMRVIITKQCC